MHDYSIPEETRKHASEAVFCLALFFVFITAAVSPVVEQAASDFLTNHDAGGILDDWRFLLFSDFIGLIIPISELGLAYLLYDKCLWKCRRISRLHKIPNLTGTWSAEVVSPLKEGKAEITMTIKQNWNKLHVEGISRSGTRTDSYTASIAVGCNGNNPSAVIFSYAYYITTYGPEYQDEFGVTKRDEEQMYPGFNSLSYDAENSVLEGDYFSNKDVTLRRESGFMSYVSGLSDNGRLMEFLKGCGSKGHIRMERISNKCIKT